VLSDERPGRPRGVCSRLPARSKNILFLIQSVSSKGSGIQMFFSEDIHEKGIVCIDQTSAACLDKNAIGLGFMGSWRGYWMYHPWKVAFRIVFPHNIRNY